MIRSLIALAAVIFPLSSYAAICVQNNTTQCRELGYTETSCPYGGISCPYDLSLKHCTVWTCSDGRYFSTNNTTQGSTCYKISYKGLECYDCTCDAPANCTWDDSNKGNATLSNKCCDGNYATCTSTCKEITVPANGRGTTSCTGCKKNVYTDFDCNLGYVKSGSTCVAATCPLGYNTGIQTTANCSPAGSGWSVSFSGQSGATKCGKCTCNASTSCKWDTSNKGTATLSNPCCNGKYTTCTSTCKGITIPANGHGTTQCTGCGTTVYTDFACNTGYVKSGTSCIISFCPTGYSTSIQTPSNCSPAGSGWSVSFRGQSGATKCGKCTCNASTSCTWDNSNKGMATISGACCNGKYATCTSTCKGITIPANGHGTTQCTGCGTTVYTDFACNTGYTKSGSSCVVATCPTGYSTSIQTTANCSPAGTGWTVSFNGQSGTTKCGKCTCNASTSCKWDSSNKGTATLSNPCCNGKYATCTSTCKGITVPANGRGTIQCNGCGTIVYTDFACNTGYIKSGSSCVQASCSAGYARSVDGCGISGSKGWRIITTTTDSAGCYKCQAFRCLAGYTVENCKLLHGGECWAGDTRMCKKAEVIKNCCSLGYKYDCEGVCTNKYPTTTGVATRCLICDIGIGDRT